MSQNAADKYLYFSVGFLKNSSALEALRDDALKHHMVDQPGQLIALRLTEYYEMMTQGIVQPVVRVPAVTRPANENLQENEPPVMSERIPRSPAPHVFQQPFSSTQYAEGNELNRQLSSKMRAVQPNRENIVPASRDADQNADEAADYWSTL
jgi:hypothetical protein